MKKEFTKGQIIYVLTPCSNGKGWDDMWYSYEKRMFDQYAYNNRGKRNGFIYNWSNPDKGWSDRNWKYDCKEWVFGSEEEAQRAVKRIDKKTKEEYRKEEEEMRKAEEELKEITMKVLKDIGADEDTVKYIEGRMIAFCGVKYEYENIRKTIEGCIKRRNERKVHENNEIVHSEIG
jgi:hypothetical protein